MADAIQSDSRIKLVKTVECESTDNEAGQTAAENLFTTNPNVKVIIAYNSAMANGVNSYVMSANSGITDKSGIGVFSTDESDEVKANIQASVNNEAVVRGIISLGGFGDI
jgi:ABC-type sugar transport system substrate-binding protein